MTHERDTLKAYFRMIAVHDPMRGNELVDALDAYLDVKFKREWVDLTDEEIKNAEVVLRNNGDYCELHFARAIEVILREKNND